MRGEGFRVLGADARCLGPVNAWLGPIVVRYWRHGSGAECGQEGLGMIKFAIDLGLCMCGELSQAKM